MTLEATPAAGRVVSRWGDIIDVLPASGTDVVLLSICDADTGAVAGANLGTDEAEQLVAEITLAIAAAREGAGQ